MRLASLVEVTVVHRLCMRVFVFMCVYVCVCVWVCVWVCVQSEEEEKEMPKEAQRCMKNIEKDTPTASGPNSFGKTARGFTVAL